MPIVTLPAFRLSFSYLDGSLVSFSETTLEAEALFSDPVVNYTYLTPGQFNVSVDSNIWEASFGDFGPSAFDADYVQIGAFDWAQNNNTTVAVFGYLNSGPTYTEYAFRLDGDEITSDDLENPDEFLEQLVGLSTPPSSLAPGIDIFLSDIPGASSEPGTIVTLDELENSPIEEVFDEIRDFGGNMFGAADAWENIGTVDIQGDGDTELVYINQELGRWATLGVRQDGTIDFFENGFGGDTRVVGIYIDPLVANGQVEAGSDFDSQQRFQRDLLSGNLGEVLGADDYNNDGFQEVYFSLASGNAVLRALMHADGNIRYANYQSEADLIGFMQNNGVDSSVYDNWF